MEEQEGGASGDCGSRTSLCGVSMWASIGLFLIVGVLTASLLPYVLFEIVHLDSRRKNEGSPLDEGVTRFFKSK